MATVNNLFEELATENTQQELLDMLAILADRLGVLSAVRDPNNALRVTIRGADTISTISTINLVSTVSTVANMAQVGGLYANTAVPSWNNVPAILGNINNVEVTA